MVTRLYDNHITALLNWVRRVVLAKRTGWVEFVLKQPSVVPFVKGRTHSEVGALFSVEIQVK